MASLDLARAYAEEIVKTNRLAKIEKEIAGMKELFLKIAGVDISEPADPFIQKDPLKLCLRSKPNDAISG